MIINGSLDLEFCKNLTSLGNIEEIKGDLFLFGCEKIKSLGELEIIKGHLIGNTELESLGKLKIIEGGLNLRRSINIKDLGNLEYVGVEITISINSKINHQWVKQNKPWLFNKCRWVFI